VPKEIRWTIKVGAEVDLALRLWLGSRGMRKGDLSKYVEEAVLWRLFGADVEKIRERMPDLSPEELQTELEGAAAAFKLRALNRAAKV
jgi:hypothetical protein